MCTGFLVELRQVEDFAIADIGKISLALPLDFALKLDKMKGKKIAILRCDDDDYRVREVCG